MMRRPLRTLLALAVAALAAPLATAATAAPLEGPPLTAKELTFADGTVLADGAPLALVDCDWLETGRPLPAAAARAQPGLGVWLVDGSWLPATALAAGDGDRLRVTSPFGVHDLPLALVAGWGANQPQAAGDGLDRVVVASGPLDGHIRGMKDGKLLIATSLDPEPLALEVADIQGLRLAPVPAPPRAAGTTLLAAAEPQRPPTRLRVAGANLVLAASGQPVSGDLLANLRLIVDGDRRRWLSELTPSAVDEQGAFGVVWPWTRDSDLAGGPLLLAGVRYSKGLTVHSAARLAWDLGGRYSRLRATVGISDAVAPEGDCPVTLRGDGQVLWKRDRLRGSDAPVPLDVDLRGVKSLELVIDLGERFDIGDHVVLAGAYVVTTR